MDWQLHPTVYIGIIIYPCPNPNAGLADPCWHNTPVAITMTT